MMMVNRKWGGFSGARSALNDSAVKINAIYLILVFFICCVLLAACKNKSEENGQAFTPTMTKDYIRPIPGENDSLRLEVVQKGEVLIAYSDCYQCHSLEKRAKGPSFQDIARRYPVNNVYMDLLAHKIINGSTGSWGNPVMDPHPRIPMEDAKTMVAFILSLKEESVVY
jgi:cytochrome c